MSSTPRWHGAEPKPQLGGARDTSSAAAFSSTIIIRKPEKIGLPKCGIERATHKQLAPKTAQAQPQDMFTTRAPIATHTDPVWITNGIVGVKVVMQMLRHAWGPKKSTRTPADEIETRTREGIEQRWRKKESVKWHSVLWRTLSQRECVGRVIKCTRQLCEMGNNCAECNIVKSMCKPTLRLSSRSCSLVVTDSSTDTLLPLPLLLVPLLHWMHRATQSAPTLVPLCSTLQRIHARTLGTPSCSDLLELCKLRSKHGPVHAAVTQPNACSRLPCM